MASSPERALLLLVDERLGYWYSVIPADHPERDAELVGLLGHGFPEIHPTGDCADRALTQRAHRGGARR